VKKFAESNGLKINFAGFWERSDNGKKVEGEDPTSGYKFIMDSTQVYYRVQNAAGSGRTIADPAYAGDQNAFNAASHFTNSAPK
jgi:hypothetical protein